MSASASEYQWHYERLQRLDAEGLNDSAAADAIRDEMDVHWRNMTTEEKAAFEQRARA